MYYIVDTTRRRWCIIRFSYCCCTAGPYRCCAFTLRAAVATDIDDSGAIGIRGLVKIKRGFFFTPRANITDLLPDTPDAPFWPCEANNLNAEGMRLRLPLTISTDTPVRLDTRTPVNEPRLAGRCPAVMVASRLPTVAGFIFRPFFRLVSVMRDGLRLYTAVIAFFTRVLP